MIRNAIQRFMYGRYGGDQLNVFLLVLYLIFYFISIWTNFLPLYWLSLVVIVWGLFRMLSRNLPRRRAENAKFYAAGRTGHQLVPPPPHHAPGQGAPLFPLPQLRSAAPGTQGQGKDHRHLPQLRRRLPGKKLKIHVPPRPFPGLGGLFLQSCFFRRSRMSSPKKWSRWYSPSSREAI